MMTDNIEKSDYDFMGAAIEQAQIAASMGEVPVGAVAIYNGEIIATAHNIKEKAADPTAHAEMLLIREVAKKLKAWRLTGVSIYVTLEPCPMCAGAMVLARIDTLVYGAKDSKMGAVGTLYDIAADSRLNHTINVRSGVRAEECAAQLGDFFKKLRMNP